MSEKQEHRKRILERLQYLNALEAWFRAEPPRWKIVSWRRWYLQRPRRV